MIPIIWPFHIRRTSWIPKTNQKGILKHSHEGEDWEVIRTPWDLCGAGNAGGEISPHLNVSSVRYTINREWTYESLDWRLMMVMIGLGTRIFGKNLFLQTYRIWEKSIEVGVTWVMSLIYFCTHIWGVFIALRQHVCLARHRVRGTSLKSIKYNSLWERDWGTGTWSSLVATSFPHCFWCLTSTSLKNVWKRKGYWKGLSQSTDLGIQWCKTYQA